MPKTPQKRNEKQSLKEKQSTSYGVTQLTLDPAISSMDLEVRNTSLTRRSRLWKKTSMERIRSSMFAMRMGSSGESSLGREARPETAASRLLWAVGYSANEDYFVPDLRVEHMQRLKRGQKLVAPDGSMHDVRLKRYSKDEKKVGEWAWQQNPFTGTRELNGLRVMMALMNNWDLKDMNNSVFLDATGKDDDPELQYTVTDLGASFGSTGMGFPIRNSKGNLIAYSRSKFILKVSDKYVDFNVPSAPSPVYIVDPKEFRLRLHLRWIGRHIPRADARWIGQLLSQLSENQIRDAFRAAGYSQDQVEGFTEVVRRRIAELQRL